MGIGTIKNAVSRMHKDFRAEMSGKRTARSAYNAACKNGWLDICCDHMEEIRKPKGYWSLGRCAKLMQLVFEQSRVAKKQQGSLTGLHKETDGSITVALI